MVVLGASVEGVKKYNNWDNVDIEEDTFGNYMLKDDGDITSLSSVKSYDMYVGATGTNGVRKGSLKEAIAETTDYVSKTITLDFSDTPAIYEDDEENFEMTVTKTTYITTINTVTYLDITKVSGDNGIFNINGGSNNVLLKLKGIKLNIISGTSETDTVYGAISTAIFNLNSATVDTLMLDGVELKGKAASTTSGADFTVSDMT